MKTIKVCPKCGSINIKGLARNFGAISTGNAFDSFKDKCMDCENTFIAEINVDELEEFRKDIKNE